MKTQSRRPKVIALARVRGGGPASVVIRFRTSDGKNETLKIARGDLLEVRPLMKLLANAGCRVPFDHKEQKELQELLASSKPKRIWEYSLSTGWVDNRFVLPDATIGGTEADNPRVLYDPDAVSKRKLADFSVSDTTPAEWKSHVAAPAVYSTTMTFVICLALAAPLLEILGIEGGGVHLDGKSSQGKSLTARVGRSVCGFPKLLTWSATISGIEVAACAFSGSLMCIDEMGEMRGNEKEQAQLIRRTAFKIASGEGTLRGGKAWDIEQKWAVFLLSTGEHSLTEAASSGGMDRLGGEEVRFPNLPCVVGPHGVFEGLPPSCSTSAQLAEKLENACRSHYGTAYRAFLDALVKDIEAAKTEARKEMQRFNEYAVVGHDGWEKRFAQKFALAAAAGVLAVRWQIVPWAEDEVLRAVKSSYRRARAAVPNTKEITEQGMKRLAKRIRNPAWTLDLRSLAKQKRENFKPKKGQGFLRHRRSLGLHLLLRKKSFASWFENPKQAQLVLQELQRQGRLMSDPRNPRLHTRQVLLWPGRPKRRYYVVKVKKDPRKTT